MPFGVSVVDVHMKPNLRSDEIGGVAVTVRFRSEMVGSTDFRT